MKKPRTVISHRSGLYPTNIFDTGTAKSSAKENITTDAIVVKIRLFFRILFTSAGFSNQKIYIFLATGLTKGEPDFDDDEFIEKYEIDINEAQNMVIKNEIEDAKTSAIMKSEYIHKGDSLWIRERLAA